MRIYDRILRDRLTCKTNYSWKLSITKIDLIHLQFAFKLIKNTSHSDYWVSWLLSHRMLLGNRYFDNFVRNKERKIEFSFNFQDLICLAQLLDHCECKGYQIRIIKWTTNLFTCFLQKRFSANELCKLGEFFNGIVLYIYN